MYLIVKPSSLTRVFTRESGTLFPSSLSTSRERLADALGEGNNLNFIHGFVDPSRVAQGKGQAGAVGGARQGCHAIPQFVGSISPISRRARKGETISRRAAMDGSRRCGGAGHAGCRSEARGGAICGLDLVDLALRKERGADLVGAGAVGGAGRGWGSEAEHAPKNVDAYTTSLSSSRD
jgi:hypothetical protein